MTKAIRCAGYVLRGMALCLCIAAGFCAAMVFLMWASVASAEMLGLDSRLSPLFFIGYGAVAFGAVIGASQCASLPSRERA